MSLETKHAYNVNGTIHEKSGHPFLAAFMVKQQIFPKVHGEINGVEMKGWPVVRLADNRVLVFGPDCVYDLEET